MKILQILDTFGWAIDSLAKTQVKATPQFNWERIAIHPKDLEQGKVDLKPIIEAIKSADLIDIEYWRVASQLFDLVPELKKKRVMLSHHNEKNLFDYDWPENVMHVATTRSAEGALKDRYPKAKVFYVPNSFDENMFHFNMEYPPEEKIVGYAGRIVPWKGLKGIAQACYELGYPLMVMGRMDKPSYFNEIPLEHQQNIRWDFFNCKDEERPDFYKNITCYVGNSGGGRETGPLGLMEAMASGVPCVSTSAGIANDIGVDDENMLLVDYDDYDSLKEAIARVMESPAVQAKLRKNGWETIRHFNNERRGIVFRNLLKEVIYGGEDLVSAIIPTTEERFDETFKILDALQEQTHQAIEAVVIVDQCLDADKPFMDFKEAIKQRYTMPINILSTNVYGGYNLALARNLGVIEAMGKYILLNDSRLKPEKEAVELLLKAIKDREKGAKVWVFGEKGGEKSTFVENFSMISRKHLIDGGMFNERITSYGGMSQCLRERFSHQGFEFGYVPNAKAEQISKSSLSPAKREGIIKMKNLLFKLDQY